jgi:adenosylcobalamin-dependent ribonucleoside-triphosphate reductase
MSGFDTMLANYNTVKGLTGKKPEKIPLPEYVVPDGMSKAVFINKYSRRKPDGTMQTYAERIGEVIDGNFLLDPRWKQAEQSKHWANPWPLYQEYLRTRELGIAGIIPTSGRHLQHGDLDQPNRLMEMHTNCSTAMFSFMLFRLLLRGSGVGRDYSSECCRVNWDFMPNVRLVLDDKHPDFNHAEFNGYFDSLVDAQHKYDSESETVRWFDVEDSREGWSKCVEILETAAWQEKHSHKLFIFNFTGVRCAGTPIMGLQGRPSSGPLGLMRALAKVASIKGAGMKPWKQALFIDHYLAACVQLGGARRSARMSTKHWKDRDVIEFIDIKRGGFLWSSNNSILVDAEFWQQAQHPKPSHARRVFEAAASAAYFDATGEPGFINVDKMNNDRTGIELITPDTYINTKIYHDLHPRTRDMIANILPRILKLGYMIVNPCAEITLTIWGGYCLVGDACLALVHNFVDAIDAVDLLTKFLVRVNLMRCEYAAEVKRTNRIGTCLTGIHEFAYNMYRLYFHDLIAYYDVVFNGLVIADIADDYQRERLERSGSFWLFIDKLRQTAEHAATSIAGDLGVTVPHTITSMKPSGTVSKVMVCTEGGHLPPYVFYLRWVQYHKNDADLVDLQQRGYPAKDVTHKYSDHWVVGFPTKQPIADLMGPENVVTADKITPEENYKWLRLLEYFWLGTAPGQNNNISYTLKYDPSQINYTDFMAMLLEYQPKVRVCSVMPQKDYEQSKKIYGYVPEEPITEEQYNNYMVNINAVTEEAYDDDELMCSGGACPIETDVPGNKS